MRNDNNKVIGYPLETFVCKDTTFWVSRDCMDSPQSPMRLKDGQRLIVHEFEGVFYPFADIDKVRGKVCAIECEIKGKKYYVVKEIIGIDELSNKLNLMFYNPEKTIVQLNIDTICRLWFVDGVVTDNK